jgi:DNA mismatch repair protein MutS
MLTRKQGYVRPEISEQPILELEGSRHPLHELHVRDFIPNDIKLDPARELILLNGPNYSGKSVFLKQVGNPRFRQ